MANEANQYDFEEVGAYKSGLFYSESALGVPWETAFLKASGVGRVDDHTSQLQAVPGGFSQTLRLVILLHETSHFIDDLSLGVCLVRDFLLDEAAAGLFELLKRLSVGPVIPCPLAAQNNALSSRDDPDINHFVEFIAERERLAYRSLMGSPDLESIHPQLREYIRSASKELPHLDTRALLEGSVAVRTQRALTARIEDAKDTDYLKAMKENLPILTENLPEVYQVARRVFDNTVGREVLGIGTAYRADSWPLNYSESARNISDTHFLYLADIALHIPPLEIVISRVKEGRNRLADFIPSNRFCQAIAYINRLKHFPSRDSTRPNDFYVQLFDSIALAAECDWPTLEETNDAWMMKLAAAKSARRAASDGYRGRIIVERRLKPALMAAAAGECDPIMLCLSQMIPIFHLTPTGFKKLSGLKLGETVMLAPFETTLANYYLFKMPCEPWKDLPRNATFDDLRKATSNEFTFQQEVLYRTLCRTLQWAIVQERHLSCPFARNGCQAAVPNCNQIVKLGDIPKSECALRDYLEMKGLAPDLLVWSS